ncbi:MAG: biopolymer transporter ExbD [Myxococcota bacterium]|nr:biopolymer transporter ExbD [Myxococcota bacterium]
MRRLFRKRPASSGLMIASFAPIIDIFTILVIAILKSSSTQAPPQFSTSDFMLPLSSQERGSDNRSTIDIAKDGIYYNRKKVASTTRWKNMKEPIIADLYTLILLNPPSKIQLRADESIPWNLIDKALMTAQQAGCTEIELLAQSRSSF